MCLNLIKDFGWQSAPWLVVTPTDKSTWVRTQFPFPPMHTGGWGQHGTDSSTFMLV